MSSTSAKDCITILDDKVLHRAVSIVPVRSVIIEKIVSLDEFK
jgi:hypothetical protein